MLIRSQDKKSLYNLGTNKGLWVNSLVKTFDIIAEGLGKIGTYSTEKKAISVLDLIQEDYENSCTVEAHIPGCDPYMLIHNTVFKMPQDSEVSE